MDETTVIAARMDRQCLTLQAGQDEYLQLYRDLQPGVNVYWNGFGNPPSLTHRASFDDIAFNRDRQLNREIVKGRFMKGNLGWIMTQDMDLFISLYRKPLSKPDYSQHHILELFERVGPLSIQQIKEETGLLVKHITPVLHRLQEAFLIYEDQYDGEWDRSWYDFSEMFPDVDFSRYSRLDALKIVLQRFAYRHVKFDEQMATSYYQLPAKDIRAAISALIDDGIIIKYEDGYILQSDMKILSKPICLPQSVFAIHKNDFLYRSNEHLLKIKYKREGCETLFYLLIDGVFHGAAYGKFRYGPPDFDDLVCDLPVQEAQKRRAEIIEAAKLLSSGKPPARFNGELVV
jgi:hypothetical protein